MNQRGERDHEPEGRASAPLLDVLIRASVFLALALLCYRVFAPFLVLMAWSLILAVTLYPLHQTVGRRIGGRQGLAATLITVLGVMLIVTPSALLLSSMGDSVQQLTEDVQQDRLPIPPPRPEVAAWPVVGKKAYTLWEKAHADLPGLVRGLQPKMGGWAKAALAMVASIGGSIMQFIAALIIAGIIMTFGEAGDRSSRAIFARAFGNEQGEELNHLAVATIRAVAQGVIGVAFIQAIIVGVCLLIAGVPWAGMLAGIVLVLGIAQVPALIVTLPVIAYLWMSGDHGSVAAAGYTVLLFVAGLADNILKPLMLGRGVDAPMPVILLGALGGMAAAGILGMFVGATFLALGYQLFMSWVAEDTETRRSVQGGPSGPGN